jgi:hypothetical protein
MKYESIADIFSAHAPVRNRLLAVAGGISDAESSVRPDGEKWTIKQIFEHVAMVEYSMLRICTRLTAAAREEGRPSDGSFSLSPEFTGKTANVDTMKLDAPERVQPVGEASIADSMERLNATTESIADLRADLADFDGTGHKFPHPYFGDLTAAEWLVIRNGHEHRHTNQIERLLDKIRG